MKRSKFSEEPVAYAASLRIGSGSWSITYVPPIMVSGRTLARALTHGAR